MSEPSFGPARTVLSSVYEISSTALEEIAQWLEQRGIRSNVVTNFAAQARTANMAFVGNGSPETVVTAPVGSVYHRLDGGAATTLYVKESGTGNTGWIAK